MKKRLPKMIEMPMSEISTKVLPFIFGGLSIKNSF